MNLRWPSHFKQQLRSLTSVASILVTALGLAIGPAHSNANSCLLITAEWEMCSDNRVQEFHPEKNEPVFAIEFDGQLVVSSWSFKDHPQEIVRIGYRALWRKIKAKLAADPSEMGADHQSVVRNGVEFIEWWSDIGDDKYIFAAAMINDRETLITTMALKVPAEFEIAEAHEVFMRNTRLRPND